MEMMTTTDQCHQPGVGLLLSTMILFFKAKFFRTRKRLESQESVERKTDSSGQESLESLVVDEEVIRAGLSDERKIEYVLM